MKKIIGRLFWDLFCIISIVGIWPRFIEPRLLSLTRVNLQILNWPKRLSGIKILHFTDLHVNHAPERLLNKISKKIKSLNPDLVVFTGDFISHSELPNPIRLKNFLCSIKSPLGCYAVLGNHDYNAYVSINDQGDYDVIENKDTLLKSWKRLFYIPTLTKKVTEKASQVEIHHQLFTILQQTPFRILHNETIQLSELNICGLGEYMSSKCDPQIAFQNYCMDFPGIILVHNPDSLSLLNSYPGDIVLCGHTHGGQVNLPFMQKRFTLLENKKYYRGMNKIENKWTYINRGISSIMPFRWFSRPELLFLIIGSIEKANEK